MRSVCPYLYDILRKVGLQSQRHEWDMKGKRCLPLGHWEHLVSCFPHSRILQSYTRNRAANITKCQKICSVQKDLKPQSVWFSQIKLRSDFIVLFLFPDEDEISLDTWVSNYAEKDIMRNKGWKLTISLKPETKYMFLCSKNLERS